MIKTSRLRCARHVARIVEGRSDFKTLTMIRNVLKRRRECGTYLATARRHRRRLKMQKRDE